MLKKLTALLLAFAMVLGASVFAIADEEEYVNGYDAEAVSDDYDEEDYAAEDEEEEVAAPDGVTVTVNGTAVVFPDAQPFIDETGRTLVPLRPIANALDIEVDWDDEARTATFTRDAESVIFTIGSSAASHVVEGEETAVPMTTEAVIIEGRTFAPARYLVVTLGYEIDWDGATRTVIIVTADEEPAVDEDEEYDEEDENDEDEEEYVEDEDEEDDEEDEE